jgi:hypothetical protein
VRRPRGNDPYVDRPRASWPYRALLTLGGLIAAAQLLSLPLPQTAGGVALRGFFLLMVGFGWLMTWLASHRIVYRITGRDFVIEVLGHPLVVVPLRSIRAVWRPRFYHYPYRRVWPPSNRLTDAVVVDAGLFRRYWVTPSDSTEFLRRMNAALGTNGSSTPEV